MNGHLNKIFKSIEQELKQIHYRWLLYRQIFGTNSYRIDLINKTSPNVFVEFQFLIIDYVVMELSKLTDKAKFGDKKNLSFHYLIEEISALGDEELANALQCEFDNLTKSCENFRKIRNKRLAHNDLVTALGEEGSPLPGVSRADIEKALEHARNIMNRVALHFNIGQTIYNEIILPLGNDGRSVLVWLQKGLAYAQLEKEGVIKRGKWRALGNLDV